MISIKRPQPPDFLLDIEGKWQKETAAAIAHYLSGNEEAFSFKVYNDSALKTELKNVFPKCAYCETAYGAAYDGDVEHFRPKGKVSEKTPQTPGYYWLANDWDNLLLSCQHCNQRRKHQLFDQEKLETQGKVDQFPLSSEDKRVSSHLDDIQREESLRLLINPCVDDPEKHFEYEITEGVICSSTEMGKTSIRVYALQRLLLVQERKKVLIMLFKQIARVKRELERLNLDPSDLQKQEFEKEFDELLSYTNDDSSYAGMCRYFVKKFINDNNL